VGLGGFKGSTLYPDTVAHDNEHHTVSSFQTTDTVLPMLPASAGATAATVRLLIRKSRISWYQNRPKDFSS
jgi:hypothetical protein